jgi:hypothetical protein
MENKGDREADFALASEKNSQSPILEDARAKDVHEVSYFQADKPKTQVKKTKRTKHHVPTRKSIHFFSFSCS